MVSQKKYQVVNVLYEYVIVICCENDTSHINKMNGKMQTW